MIRDEVSALSAVETKNDTEYMSTDVTDHAE